MSAPSAPPGRPGTVTVAAAVLLAGAGFGVLACGGVNLVAAAAGLPGTDLRLLAVVSGVMAGLSVLSGALGYFVLRGRQWARVTVIVICVLAILASLVSFFAGYDLVTEGGGLLGTCGGAVLSVLVIFLLSGARASDYFRYGRR